MRASRFLRVALVFGACAAIALSSAAAARAERTQVYSLAGLHCADCGVPITKSIRKVKGVKKATFDYRKAEATVVMADGVPDEAILDAVRHAEPGEHYSATPGAGHGAYMPFPDYPAGVDVMQLTATGAAVGPLEKARVEGKYTIFDVYADWCMPCRTVDETLREIASKRTDVAFRRLNVVSFETPLAKELGSSLKALPYVVVFSPDGKRTTISGLNQRKLLAALARK